MTQILDGPFDPCGPRVLAPGPVAAGLADLRRQVSEQAAELKRTERLRAEAVAAAVRAEQAEAAVRDGEMAAEARLARNRGQLCQECGGTIDESEAA